MVVRVFLVEAKNVVEHKQKWFTTPFLVSNVSKLFFSPLLPFPPLLLSSSLPFSSFFFSFFFGFGLGRRAAVSPEITGQMGRVALLPAVRRAAARSFCAVPTIEPHFVLQYDYVADVLQKREPHREGHLALATQFARLLLTTPCAPHTAPLALRSNTDTVTLTLSSNTHSYRALLAVVL